MDKFGKIRRRHWKKRLKISKIAKFQSDLLKSNEDTAPQSRDIFEALFSVVSTDFPWLVHTKSWKKPWKDLFQEWIEPNNFSENDIVRSAQC